MNKIDIGIIVLGVIAVCCLVTVAFAQNISFPAAKEVLIVCCSGITGAIGLGSKK